MSFTQELWSWLTPTSLPLSNPPQVGSTTPITNSLKLPRPDSKPVVIAFLRHCGCPFAEKTFLRLRQTASQNPGIYFVAVSHSSESHTKKWLSEIGGPGETNPVEIIVDEDRKLYAEWGLGVSSFLHVLSPGELGQVFKLAREEGIKNRPTESGNRWQTSGAWAVDGQGTVTWGGIAKGASEIPDFQDAVASLKSQNV
ncbi:uncharacterized protein CTRU02_214986 [Colletotrichum truncatum]|uniref:Uncharacterized protein n=1 Tax=Colletotrichum truncatum TaxID=5467 RepID=A0ACC3YEC8_COLTU|nr:uncharacterized protein CTRU02_08262 [Colletotrichum truncatum]KAF6790133.1 hypothetical protein CTRU02_08262 [Colletotrichum truncatum]